MQTDEKDVMTSQFFSVISKIERSTRIGADYSYKVTLHGITAGNIDGFKGLLMAEMVEQYEEGTWREVDVTRGDHTIKEPGEIGYILDFEIRRKELIDQSSVYQKSLRLFIGDTLCDMDESEIVPVNKQVNNIAELQDRQTDFTTGFKIRKTRRMRELFELSGEVGANTLFPYQVQPARLIQDNIEMISTGRLILNRVDDQYYHVSIYSGNVNFFKMIDSLKLSDLDLATTEHTWNAITQSVSHAVDGDYLYPLFEPSDDGGMCPLTDDGDRIDLYGGWLFPFIKIKAIWDEIFLTAGYSYTGEIFDETIFSRLFMPISNLKITKGYTDSFLYSAYWTGYQNVDSYRPFGWTGAVLINGDEPFRLGFYTTPFAGTYKIRIYTYTIGAPTVRLNIALGVDIDFTLVEAAGGGRIWEIEHDSASGVLLSFWTTDAEYYYYSIAILSIDSAAVGYGSDVYPRLHLPDMTQAGFVKLICNLFGLVPQTNPRTKVVRFWNYGELYDNIAIARDWSAYLSERDDDVEFKFGDYAQNNYLKYKDSQDVIPDNGKGTMRVDDLTLPFDKTIVEVPVSYSDEVIIYDDLVTVSRIAMNKWVEKESDYVANESIDPRIVYIKSVGEVGSPPATKTFGISEGVTAGVPSGFVFDVVDPKIASSLEVSFSSLIVYYAHISRMLTKTNLRKAKMNLPVYEVAGLQHNIPVYLSQYKAYFYVNKITNYVAGKLCTVELLKL